VYKTDLSAVGLTSILSISIQDASFGLVAPCRAVLRVRSRCHQALNDGSCHGRLCRWSGWTGGLRLPGGTIFAPRPTGAD
jgi:hypothetical protein